MLQTSTCADGIRIQDDPALLELQSRTDGMGIVCHFETETESDEPDSDESDETEKYAPKAGGITNTMPRAIRLKQRLQYNSQAPTRAEEEHAEENRDVTIRYGDGVQDLTMLDDEVTRIDSIDNQAADRTWYRGQASTRIQ